MDKKAMLRCEKKCFERLGKLRLAFSWDDLGSVRCFSSVIFSFLAKD